MDGWMDGWMGGWMGEWIDAWREGGKIEAHVLRKVNFISKLHGLGNKQLNNGFSYSEANNS
jgi:hypothetical protein